MRVRHLLAVAGVVCAIGCGSDPHKIVSVSGKVTLNGKPIEKATVLFTPVAPAGMANSGPGSIGITDAEGNYTLKTIAVNDTGGAVVGKHKVRITNAREPWDPDVQKKPPPKTGEPIPAKYNKLDGGLEFEVPPGGTSKADFALTSP